MVDIDKLIYKIYTETERTEKPKKFCKRKKLEDSFYQISRLTIKL